MRSRLSARRLVLVSAMLALGYTQTMAQPTNAPPDAPQPRNSAPSQDVPVTTVMLFSSGVGYFEHNGQVTGNGAAQIRFKAAQINDILKSLVLQDLDGGKVSAVTYPSLDPVDKTLKSFQVDITGNPPLAQLLNQLRGARVTVRFGADQFPGTVLGVEAKAVVVNETTVTRHVLNLLSGGTVRSIELESVSELTLEDPDLQQELAKALAALSQARDQDKKPVNIEFRGEGRRRVRLGYVVETPVWKTSYRLILGDEAAKPRLQGWAIVENQTDNDWSNVSLSLVSGRPISFVMDLYTPLYVPRPVVQQELYASLRPPLYEEGMAAAAPIAGAARDESRAGAERAKAARAPAAFAEGIAAGRPLDPSASVQSIADAEQVGELFSYTVGNVSLARQKSAMLPIITDDIAAEKLSIYNAAVLQNHPLNGVRLTNSTAKHLLAGPVTVIEGGAYAGDARLDNLPPGQNRLLSYGIDLQMRVDATRNSSESSVLSGRISQGVLYVTRKYIASQTYLAENKADRDKTLLVEHPIRQGWKLIDTPKPEESTEQLYRFRTAVPAGKQASLTVNEQLVSDETMAILPMDVDQILLYARTGEIPQPVKDALARAAEYKRNLNATQRQLQEMIQKLNAIAAEQNRLRENMKTVDSKTDYYNRLLKKLNDQESQIEAIQGQRDQLQEKLEQQRAQLEEYLRTLNVG